MAVSIIDVLAEKSRIGRTGDDYYNKKLPWIFKIKVDGGSFIGPTGYNGEAIFPLPVPPDQFDYDLPYSVNLSPQQEGGIVSEENGFVIGEIRISATTGFKLRRQQTLTYANNPGKFTGMLGVGGGAFDEVSGQMAFWILAQRCFEGYSELKKDSKYGPKTRMELHIMKEHLHLEVIPRTFKLTRNAARERVTYRYEILLSVVGEVEGITFKSIDEKNIFDKISDSINSIKQSIQSIAAVVDDITASIGEISRIFNGISSLVDDLKTIINAGTNFINGVKSFFDIPSNLIDNVSDLVESAASFFEDASTLPLDVYQSFLKIGDSLDALKVAARDYFIERWSEVSQKYNNETEPGIGSNVSSVIQTQIDNKYEEGSNSQGQMTIVSAFGGPIKPGDKKRQTISQAEKRLDSNEYNGFSERVVGQGDTIQSLAAKHLGDARKWIDLVIVNKLHPPYITNGAKIPNTLSVGDNITIPISKSTRSLNILTDGNVKSGYSQVDVYLGTDFELTRINKDQWGWVIDSAHGSIDAKKITGVNCVSQGLFTRLKTIKGENIMFPDVGLPRFVGTNQSGDEIIEAEFNIREQIMSDPRIERLNNISFDVINDELSINIEIQPIGFNTSRVISRVVS